VSLLQEVVGLLRREGIAHALIGAAAMAVHGVSRATADIDFLTMDVRSLEPKLWSPVSGHEVTLRILRGDFDDPLAGSVRLTSSGDRIVDVVVGRYRWQAELVDSAEVVSVGELDLPVVRPAGLVLLKLHAGGAKDAWDIRSLLESHDQAASIQAEVDQAVSRLAADSRRLWERIRDGL
jgi:hypothetical protein